MSYVLPQMSLLGISIGTDTGLTIETNANSNYAAIDSHNHTSGQGRQIPVDGISVASDFPFNDNNIVSPRSMRFQVQPSALSGALDRACLYSTGPGEDLFYNDGAGNKIPITNGGAVAVTSTGIFSGTASASFVSGVLVVDSDTNIPADISVGSVLLGDDTSTSVNRLTISPPASLSTGSYTLVLPAKPVSTKFMTLDSSGNMGTASSISATQIAPTSIQGTQIAIGTVTGSNIGAATITQANMAILSVQGVSFSTFTTMNSSPTLVPGSSVSITVIGGAVQGVFSGACLTVESSAYAGPTVVYTIKRNSTTVYTYSVTSAPYGTSIGTIPAGCLNFLDFPGPGTFTYALYVACSPGSDAIVGGITAGGFGIFEL